jgi:hypothetical protein
MRGGVGTGAGTEPRVPRAMRRLGGGDSATRQARGTTRGEDAASTSRARPFAFRGRGAPAAFRHLRRLTRARARCASEVGRRRPGEPPLACAIGAVRPSLGTRGSGLAPYPLPSARGDRGPQRRGHDGRTSGRCAGARRPRRGRLPVVAEWEPKRGRRRERGGGPRVGNGRSGRMRLAGTASPHLLRIPLSRPFGRMGSKKFFDKVHDKAPFGSLAASRSTRQSSRKALDKAALRH